MIQELVNNYMKNKDAIRAELAKSHVTEYKKLVRLVVKNIRDKDMNLDPTRIHEIDDGHYQGTLLYIVASDGYQPRDYWFVMISYGSCSGCDTLQSIFSYSDEKPTEDQLDQYMTLTLHIVQGIKKLGDFNDVV